MRTQGGGIWERPDTYLDPRKTFTVGRNSSRRVKTIVGTTAVAASKKTSLVWKYVPCKGNLAYIAARHGTRMENAVTAMKKIKRQS